METTTSSPARPLEPPALSLTLPIVEDIPAELGEFVRLYKYGFWNEADDFFQDVLADHICHFPVVAELIEFLVEQGNYKRLRLVLAKELPRRRGSVAVTTNGTEEKKLLEHYEAVAVLYTQFKIDALAKTMAEDYLDRLKNKDAMSDIEIRHLSLCLLTASEMTSQRDALARLVTSLREMKILRTDLAGAVYKCFAEGRPALAALLVKGYLLISAGPAALVNIVHQLDQCSIRLQGGGLLGSDVELLQFTHICHTVWNRVLMLLGPDSEIVQEDGTGVSTLVTLFETYLPLHRRILGCLLAQGLGATPAATSHILFCSDMTGPFTWLLWSKEDRPRDMRAAGRLIWSKNSQHTRFVSSSREFLLLEDYAACWECLQVLCSRTDGDIPLDVVVSLYEATSNRLYYEQVLGARRQLARARATESQNSEGSPAESPLPSSGQVSTTNSKSKRQRKSTMDIIRDRTVIGYPF